MQRESTTNGSDGRPGIRELIAEALKYWEPRRILYNVALTVVVIFYFALAWPHSKSFLSVNASLFLFILAVLANICYCGVYVVDVFVQLSSLRSLWLEKRWLLFALGTVFAAVIVRFFSL